MTHDPLRTAPLRDELPSVVFPGIVPIEAPVGWQCYGFPDATTPLVFWQLVLPLGSAHAPQPGLARLSMRSLLRGTRYHSAEEFHTRLESYGATLEVSVGHDWTTVQCVCLRSVMEEVLALVLEMLCEPDLAEEEIAREKQRQEAALREWCQAPEALAYYAMLHALAPGHPYAVPVLGTASALAQLTAEECRRWYDTVRRALPRVMLIGGAITEDDARRWLERFHEGFPEGETASVVLPQLPRDTEPTVVIAPKAAAVQSTLVLGLPAPMPWEDAYAATFVVTAVLGGHFLSRLNRRLREHEGMTYGISAALRIRRAGAFVRIESAVDTEQVARAYRLVAEELQRLQHELIAAEELQRVVRILYGWLLRQMVTPAGVLDFYAAPLLLGLPVEFPHQLFERIRRIQPEELYPVQQRYFRPERLVVGVSGDAERLRQYLAWLAEPRVVSLPCEVNAPLSTL